jgi:PIN domain nuclease of toxin-antitoxin system
MVAPKDFQASRPLSDLAPENHQIVNVHQAKTHLSQLLQQVVERMQAPGAEVFVSQASLWEMAIKLSIGRLQVDLPDLERYGSTVILVG